MSETGASWTWPESVRICEVGLRDGLQNEKKLLSVEEKLTLLDMAVDSGIKIIEVGSFVHPKAVPQMADTEEVVRRMKRVEGVEYRALVPNLKGLERAHNAGLTKAKLTVSVSDTHCLVNFNKKPIDMMAGFAECVEYAAKNNITISGALSSAWGCAFEGRIPVAQIEKIVKEFLKLGIKELSLSDATGMGNPRQVYEVCSYMVKTYPEISWVLHFHNTRDMAMANIVAGLQAGVRTFDGAFAGLGGCPYIPGAAGNIATEDVIHMLHEMGIKTGVDLVKAMATARAAQEMVGHPGASAVLKAGRNDDLKQAQNAKRQDNK